MPLANVRRPVRDDFVPIDLQTLRLGHELEFDLYLIVRGEFVLYCEQSLAFDATVLNSLRANGVETLYAAPDAAEKVAEYYEQHLSSIVSDEQVPVAQRARAAVQAAENLARVALHNPDGRSIDRARGVIEQLANLTCDTPGVVSRLIHLVGDGSTLRSHAVNTAIFALAMADTAEATSVRAVGELATAGLFHDVGLGVVRPDILRKAAPLDADERKLIQEHPVTGEQILRRSGALSDDVLLAVRWHHERMDGSGYPDHLRGQSIPWMARAVAIAEVFDSLTSDQPYRQRLSPFEALRIMMNEMRDALDASLLKRFVPKLLQGEADTNSGLTEVAAAVP